MPAIAPPMENQPVQPIAPDTPVGGVVAPAQADAAVDLHSMYEDAVNSGNPASMYSLTARVKGTPYEAPVRRSAEIMQKNLSEFEAEVKPVVEAGGPGTPQGNIAASKVYENIADKPQKMRAFVELLIGNPKWRTFVTGGTPTTTVGYDRNGKQIEKTVDELGRTISMVDAETGKPLNREEVAARGGFLPSLDNALGFQQEKEISKFNTAAFNKANEATNEIAARAPALRSMYEEMQQNLRNLNQSDLSPEQRRAIGQFTTRSMSYAQSLTEGMNALAQKLDNKNARLSESQTNALNGVLGANKWKLNADGSISKENGEAVTKSDLQQAQNTMSNSAEFQRNFTQNKDDFLRSEVFRNLGEKEMQILGRALDLQGSIERANLELASKHGTLPFLINPRTYQLGDEFARGEASALIGQFNQDATEMYANWRQRQLEAYKRNNRIPNAGELEAAFTQTAEYKNLRREYAEKNKEILKRPAGGAPQTAEAPAQQWSADIGMGKPAGEGVSSVRGRSLKQPEAKPATKEATKPKTPSVRDLAKQFGGRD